MEVYNTVLYLGTAAMGAPAVAIQPPASHLLLLDHLEAYCDNVPSTAAFLVAFLSGTTDPLTKLMWEFGSSSVPTTVYPGTVRASAPFFGTPIPQLAYWVLSVTGSIANIAVRAYLS